MGKEGREGGEGDELTSVSDLPATFLAGREDCGRFGGVDGFLIKGRG